MRQAIRILFLLHGFYFTYIFALKSGPFTSTLVRAGNCTITQHPWEPEPSAKAVVESYKFNKKNLLRGNYTVLKPDPSIKVSIQEYLLVNGEWKLIFHIRKLSCRSRVNAVLAMILNVKFNKKNCVVTKGVHSFNNIDIDIIDHVTTSSREYGAVRKIFELTNKRGNTVVCIELESEITPKKG